MTTTTQQFEEVVEFMSVAGQTVNTEWRNPSTKVANFRLKLINEEINGKNELFDSIDNDNLIGILDGICDVLYVAYGAYATFGMKPVTSDVYKQLEKVSSEVLSLSTAFTMRRHIKDGFEQTNRGLVQGDYQTILTGLNNIVLATIQLSYVHNFDLVGAFTEVHKSNMSKFCKSRADAEADIAFRVATNEDYIDATVSEITYNGNTFYIINRAGDGKVLKGTGFFEPNLSKFIA